MVAQIFIFLLLADAAWVAYGLIKQRIMWRWICLYWILLTAKNLCDICGKELSEDFSDVVNLDFNSFGTVGFTLEIDKYKPKDSELNLCVECAEKVVSDIEDLRKIEMLKGR